MPQPIFVAKFVFKNQLVKYFWQMQKEIKAIMFTLHSSKFRLQNTTPKCFLSVMHLN